MLLGVVTTSAIVFWLYFNFYPFGTLLAWLLLAALGLVLGLRLDRGWLCGTAIGMFAFGMCSFPYFLMEGHSISPYRLKHVKLGVKAEIVRSILGSPTSIHRRPTGEEWTYSGMTWCYVKIAIDAQGTVTYVDHDH